MAPLKRTLIPAMTSLSCAIALIAALSSVHAQSAAKPHTKKSSGQAVSHTELWCSWQGLCKTIVKPGPATFKYTHGCKMSAKPGCLKWGAYAKGVDF